MKLRFACLCRVSTEDQEATGHSLETQEATLKKQVEANGGEIVKWYKGQEHSGTGSAFRPIFEELQKDLSNGLWDILVVTAFDRLGRDSMEINLFMKMLRQNHKRLYVGGQAVDLNKPEGKLQANLLSSIAQFYVDQTAEKSLSSKIRLVKEGIPACGKMPYGRVFDRATKQWGIDPEKQAFVKRIAKEYLDAGIPMYRIAAREQWQSSKLWNLLKNKCGSDFEIKFLPDEYRWMRDMIKDAQKIGDVEAEKKIKKEIETHKVCYLIKVPPLLDAKMLARIKDRAEANRKTHRRPQKYKYALSNMVFCAQCSHSFHGQTKERSNGNFTRGYRHTIHILRQKTEYGKLVSLEGERQRREKHKTSRRQRVTCGGELTWINAEELEKKVLEEVWGIMTHPGAMKKALDLDGKNYHEAGKIKAELSELEKQIGQEKKKLDNLIDAVADGTFTLAEVKEKKLAIEGRKQGIEEKAAELRGMEILTMDDAHKSATQLINQMRGSLAKLGDIEVLDEMSWEEKRSLLIKFGTTVFVDYVTKGKKKTKTFIIKGILGEKKIEGKEPLFCGGHRPD